jgi:hypothetical protein
MSTTTSNRIDDIAAKLHTACGVIAEPTRQSNALRETINELSVEMNGIGGSRLSVAANIAALAHAEGWTDSEIAQAIAKATKMSNNNDAATKTLGVFISEMKQFASPRVRADFPAILDACQSAWLAEQDYLAGLEGDEKKNADTPIRKFKPRIYHLVIEAARRTKDGEVTLRTVQDVIDWARANDPAHNEKIVARQIAAAITKLEEVFANFGLSNVPDVSVVTEYLRTLTAKELLAARTKMLAEVSSEDDTEASDSEEQDTTSAAPAADAKTTSEVVEGAYDYTQDALNAHEHLDALAA